MMCCILLRNHWTRILPVSVPTDVSSSNPEEVSGAPTPTADFLGTFFTTRFTDMRLFAGCNAASAVAAVDAEDAAPASEIWEGGGIGWEWEGGGGAPSSGG